MPDDHSWGFLGDAVEALIGELDARVNLDPEDRRVVLTALIVAANNGRVIGMREAAAQAEQQGRPLPINLTADEQAPSTLREALGEG
jgi:hypothetical protein